jgi:hypothetical protein
MFVQPQYGIFFMSHFWSLDFEVVSVFLENVCTPDYSQYWQNFVHSRSLSAVIFVKFIIKNIREHLFAEFCIQFKIWAQIPDELEIFFNIFGVEACGQIL